MSFCPLDHWWQHGNFQSTLVALRADVGRYRLTRVQPAVLDLRADANRDCRPPPAAGTLDIPLMVRVLFDALNHRLFRR